MSEEALKIISDVMEKLGLNYEFMEWTGDRVYQYFTGEYQEVEKPPDSITDESKFILSGFARRQKGKTNPYLSLENAKKKIKKKFNKETGYIVTTDTGSVVAIFYSSSFPVRTVDADLKKIQINLDVMEWSVE